ncbi:hypothetical protein LSTR_LSTR003561 [Laodelphax striatellus]|uniref:HYDIN/VesB/CFA65-like Ig-like domain-containing protein n=1 Tax=Laodelphax striatellus TaxID=195883 RepID=A0A482WLU9_LAOST|nr:hypothetical protein LSTR_LSTR003561 [Laodelphax striatellus]
MFDCNGVDCVRFTPEFGFLEPFQTLRIVASYTNNLRGQKFHQFMCLIENHPPIPVHIICIEKKISMMKMPNQCCFIVSKHFFRNIEISISDELKRIIDACKNNRNCIQLSEQYIDFGTCRFGDIKQKTITLTNISGAETTIQWVSMGQSDLGKNKVFRIEQEYKTIIPSQSMNLDLFFTPNQHDKFYSGRFDATLFWMERMILIPIKIILIGNSFQHHTWIAEYSLQKNSIHLMTCQELQNSSNFRTFTLKRHSHLPMMFKLHSSTARYFNIEPRQGMILGPYQIFAVKSNKPIPSNKLCSKLLNEILTLEINLDYQVDINISQKFEEPTLIINDGKPVIFPVTHPLSCQIVAVGLKNSTKCCLRYSFEDDEPSSPFKLPRFSSIINGNEYRKSFWYFIPMNVGHHAYTSSLSIYKIGSEEIIKRIPISIEGECVIGHFKVDKENFSLGKIILGSYETEFFTIMNDGKCTLNITLGCKTLSGIELTEILFHPSRITIGAGERVQVELKAKPLCIDQHSMKIGCYLRSSPYSRQTIENSWMDLAVFDMIGIYPKLKIVDVKIESIPFLTKYNIWKILEINRLNNALGNLTFEVSSKPIEINLPILKSYPSLNNKIDIDMLIKNESDCNTKWSLRKKDNQCSCKLEEKRIGFNTFMKTLCCEHVDKIIIVPTFGVLQSSNTMLWKIRVEYFPPGLQKVEFVLDLFPENKSELASSLPLVFSRAVPDEDKALFPCDLAMINSDIHFEMQPIFINELKSQSQVLWVYNPFKHPVNYSVQKLCGGTMRRFIKCLNPSETVQPFSQHPMIFSYLPVTINPAKARYKISIDNRKLYNLTVTGSSQLYPQYNPYVLCKKMATGKSLFPSSEVELSVNHIAFPVISPNCAVNRIFFINNNTDKILRYYWKRVIIKGRLKLEVSPKSGRLQPMQRSLLTLKCSTLGRTCHLLTGLVCRVVDESLEIKYQKNKLKFLKEEDISAQEFTITEKGTSFPEKRSLPEEDLNQKFLTLNVSVVTSTVNLKRMESPPGFLGLMGREFPNSDSFSTTGNDISALHSADILSCCLWDIIHSSDLEILMKSRLPCVNYKDLSRKSSVENEEVKTCPTECITTLLTKILSDTLGSEESCKEATEN